MLIIRNINLNITQFLTRRFTTLILPTALKSYQKYLVEDFNYADNFSLALSIT